MKNARRSSRSSALETVAELEVPAVAVGTPGRFDRYSGCCARFDWERGIGVFSLEEPNRRVIDVERTFAPKPRFPVILSRCAFLGLSVATLTLDLVKYYPPENLYIYCGFLSQWALILSMFYQLSALLCSVFQSSVTQPPKGSYRPSFLVKVMWLSFAVALNLELFASILYWAFLFNGSGITFSSIMKHTGVFVALLLDGLVVGKIPIRVHHLVAVWFIDCLYLIWMGINEALGIGNGAWAHENPDDEVNDDALYGIVRWKDDPWYSFFVITVAMFCVVPALFLMLWIMSFASAGFNFNGTGYRLYDYSSRSESESKSDKETDVITPGLDTYLADDHTAVTGHDTYFDDTTAVTNRADLSSMWVENAQDMQGPSHDFVPLDDDRDESFYAESGVGGE